jgi:hypothetical protein
MRPRRGTTNEAHERCRGSHEGSQMPRSELDEPLMVNGGGVLSPH